MRYHPFLNWNVVPNRYRNITKGPIALKFPKKPDTEYLVLRVVEPRPQNQHRYCGAMVTGNGDTWDRIFILLLLIFLITRTFWWIPAVRWYLGLHNPHWKTKHKWPTATMAAAAFATVIGTTWDSTLIKYNLMWKWNILILNSSNGQSDMSVFFLEMIAYIFGLPGSVQHEILGLSHKMHFLPLLSAPWYAGYVKQSVTHRGKEALDRLNYLKSSPLILPGQGGTAHIFIPSNGLEFTNKE